MLCVWRWRNCTREPASDRPPVEARRRKRRVREAGGDMKYTDVGEVMNLQLPSSTISDRSGTSWSYSPQHIIHTCIAFRPCKQTWFASFSSHISWPTDHEILGATIFNSVRSNQYLREFSSPAPPARLDLKRPARTSHPLMVAMTATCAPRKRRGQE